MSTQALAIVDRDSAVARTPLLEPTNLAELNQLGVLMANSGFFADARQAAQACVKILAGREMGFPPIASMTGIHIINGKPATGAGLVAAAMKRAGYSWTVDKRDAEGCKLTVYFRGQKLGISEFLKEDAERAQLFGKGNWKTFPRSLFFARAITDAARTYAPEVLAGIPAYTAEELGAENTTDDGSPVLDRKQISEQRTADEAAKAAAQTPPPAPKPTRKPKAEEQIAPRLAELWSQCDADIAGALTSVNDEIAGKVGDDEAGRAWVNALKVNKVANWEQMDIATAKKVVRDLWSYSIRVQREPVAVE